MDEQNIFYVYEHYRPDDETPFYVGKGKKYRAYSKEGRNKWWRHIVEKHGTFEVRFVAENLNEMDAWWMENMYIVGWGRADLGEGPLVNLSNGGEGCSGAIQTAEHIEKNRVANSGERNAMYGVSMIPWNKGLKGAQIGWSKGTHNHPSLKWSEERRKRQRGYKDSPETLLKKQIAHENLKWIVNITTKETKLIRPNATVPDGWKFGRK